MAVLDRQKKIVDMLMKSDKPISGSTLAKQFEVSRQIIVSDINHLRENGYDIIPTPKGYVISRSGEISKVFKVYHKVEETEDELFSVVDLGGEVRDVFIYHKIYGEIRAKLSIRSRKDASDFCEDIASGQSSPLMTATGGYHYHTIVTRDIESMKLIEETLKAKGYLAQLTEYEPDSLTK